MNPWYLFAPAVAFLLAADAVNAIQIHDIAGGLAIAGVILAIVGIFSAAVTWK